MEGKTSILKRAVAVAAALGTLMIGLTPVFADETPAPVNIAPRATVTASGRELANDKGPEKAIDGQVMPENGTQPTVHNAAGASRWSANNADAVWLQLDFQTIATFSSVKAHWGNTYATSWKLEVSNDGTKWTTLKDHLAASEKGQVQEVTFDKQQARYVKLTTATRNQQWPMSLWEFEVFGSLPEPSADRQNLLPLPKHVEFDENNARYTIAADACITAPQEFTHAVELLRSHLKTAWGIELPAGADCAITFEKNTTVGTGSNEAYELVVADDGVRVDAYSNRAAIWAAQTITQLLGQWANSPERLATEATLPLVSIEDEPRYEWRGLMVDPSRSFMEVSEIKHLIDLMSSVKINRLHMHLNDDQGWRLEITNEGKEATDTIDYGDLVTKGSIFAIKPTTNAPKAGVAGYYSKAEFIDIVKYAAQQGITIVPEIEGPGHTYGMLRAIDSLRTANSKPNTSDDVTTDFNEDWWLKTTVDANNEATYTFLKHVITTVRNYIKEGEKQAGLTTAYTEPTVHIGGDEAAGTTVADYKKYMERVTSIVTETGAKPVMWNEAIDNESVRSILPSGSIAQHWNDTSGSQAHRVAFVGQGGKMLFSHVQFAYYPLKPANDLHGVTWACGGACTIERHYNVNPSSRLGVNDTNIVGVEGALWNEHVRTSDDRDAHIFPRLFSMAEVGWTPQADRNFKDFTTRLAVRSTEFLSRGANFHLTDMKPVTWSSSYAPLAVSTKTKGLTKIGLIAQPGRISTPSVFSATLTKKNGSTMNPISVGVTTTMKKSFVYSVPNTTLGRHMNTLIEVFAQLPETLAPGEYTLTLVREDPITADSTQGDRVAALDLNGLTQPITIVGEETEEETSEGSDAGTDTSDTETGDGDTNTPAEDVKPAEDDDTSKDEATQTEDTKTEDTKTEDKKTDEKKVDEVKAVKKLASTGSEVLVLLAVAVMLAVAGVALTLGRCQRG